MSKGSTDIFESDQVRATLKSDSLKFFIVENTAKRQEFYLAENAKFARILASFHRLVEDRENALVLLPTEKFWEAAPGFRGAVKRAIAARKPGKLVKRGQFALIGDEVFSPIAEVN